MKTCKQVLEYIHGGKGKITVLSLKSGTHFTYKFFTGSRPDYLFVSVLNGPDNQSNYAYMGMVTDRGLKRTAKSRVGEDAPSFKALDWVLKMCISKNENLFEVAQIEHSGICGRCGRELTTPESIERGIGPVCAGLIGG